MHALLRMAGSLEVAAAASALICTWQGFESATWQSVLAGPRRVVWVDTRLLPGLARGAQPVALRNGLEGRREARGMEASVAAIAEQLNTTRGDAHKRHGEKEPAAGQTCMHVPRYAQRSPRLMRTIR